MIDVARNVVADAAIDRPSLIHAEKILAVALFNLFVRYSRAGIFDDSLSFWNEFRCKQTQTRV